MLQVVIADGEEKTKVKADVLVVPVAGRDGLNKLGSLAWQREIKKEAVRLGFDGGWGKAELLQAPKSGVVGAAFVGLVGLDLDEGGNSSEGWRRGIGRLIQEARRRGLQSIAVDLTKQSKDKVQKMAVAIVDGVELAGYRFSEYSPALRRESRIRDCRRLTIVVREGMESTVRRAVRQEQRLLKGVSLTRDLVNQPAAAMSPARLVQEARDIARQSTNITIKVLNKQAAKKAKFSAFLAVAEGADTEPYVIHLRYKPKKKVAKKVFLVGKGITFDSGGLSLKPSDGMETMKLDMAGAATVLGLFSVISELDLDVEVHGIIAACENMPSGKAYRPGDVLTAKNGKTIEVLNTDAEGRVTLADVLSYAVEQKADTIIDLATLTGACVVALGETHAGLWSTKTELRDQLLTAAEKTGESLVSLPLPEEYKPMIKSQIADVRNTSVTRWGGAITAALFLREFVADKPWAHIDIAGPSFAEKDWLPYWQYGGTGFGVRLLANYLKNLD